MQDVLNDPIEGLNLQAETLSGELADGPVLLVFLRHAGCIFCREMIADLRRIAADDPNYPRVVFFFMATPADARPLFERLWPSAAVITDPHKHFYDAFGVEQGGLGQMFGVDSLVCGARAALKGHTLGRPKGGDIWTLPTLLLVENGRIMWEHRGETAADHPEFATIGM